MLTSVLSGWAHPAPEPTDAFDAALKADRVVVFKSLRRLVLLRQGRVVRHYRIVLGSNPVRQKQIAGDGRTPQGVYQLDGRTDSTRFHKAIRISYPNAEDEKRAMREGNAPGGDIVIHGLPDGREYLGESHLASDWTDGCIGVTNAEMEEVWRLTTDGMEIVIRP